MMCESPPIPPTIEPPGGYQSVDELYVALSGGETKLRLSSSVLRELIERLYSLENQTCG